MDTKQLADLEAAAAAARQEADDAGGTDEALNQAAEEAEATLRKAKVPSRTEKEKAAFSLKKTAERLAELGGDPASVLGIQPTVTPPEDLTDDTPLTVGALRKLRQQDARKSAEEMVNAIEDEEERERVKHELTFIVPSGDAEADFRRALAAANVEHNAKVVEEISRQSKPKLTASGGSAPAKPQENQELTPEELVFTRPPYNLSKEKILANRPK